MPDSHGRNGLRLPASGTAQPAADTEHSEATEAVVAHPAVPLDPEDAHPPGVARIRLCKAGCGFRFDPETLAPDTGFDFSAAAGLREGSAPEDG